MQRVKMASDREWSPSPFHPDWERAGLWNDRPVGGERKPGTKYTTAVRRRGAGKVKLPPFEFEWELFLYAGQVEIESQSSGSDRVSLHPGDYCCIEKGESIVVHTNAGCEYLVIAR